MKVAIVYDRVNKWGGAESVLLTLHEIFPEAPLYTAVYNPNLAPWAKVFPEVKTSFLQNIPFLNNHHELLGAITPIAFESFNFDKYDLVISVTSDTAKGIITKPKTIHLCYCLTPTRYLWSGYEEYLNNPPAKLNWIPFYKLVSQPLLKYLKHWDLIAGQRPDMMIAISEEVRRRIKKYYDQDSEVIYPPVKVGLTVKAKNIRDKYYLVVSRLVPYKKVDLVVKAFNKLGLPLVVVGTGSEEKKLKMLAKSNIKFTGFVSEELLFSYYQQAKALIFPQEEDFGLTAVEAQGAGCPVIAYKGGGALETVIEDKTGIFFDKQEVDSLVSAVKRFDPDAFSKADLVKNAERFSIDKFKESFRKYLHKHQISVNF